MIDMEKRLNRLKSRTGRVEQSKGMPCIICTKLWDDCPHSLAEVDDIIAVYKNIQIYRKYFCHEG